MVVALAGCAGSDGSGKRNDATSPDTQENRDGYPDVVDARPDTVVMPDAALADVDASSADIGGARLDVAETPDTALADVNTSPDNTPSDSFSLVDATSGVMEVPLDIGAIDAALDARTLDGAIDLDSSPVEKADSGSGGDTVDAQPAMTLAVFGGAWQKDTVDGGSTNFEISSGPMGLHAYVEISPSNMSGASGEDRATVVVLLANIPTGTGWSFRGACTVVSANMTTCDPVNDGFYVVDGGMHAGGFYMGGYFDSGVAEASDGSLAFTSTATAIQVTGAPDPQVTSSVVLTYDSRTAGGSLTVHIAGTSESGRSIGGQLQGQLVSLPGSKIILKVPDAGTSVNAIKTASRP